MKENGPSKEDFERAEANLRMRERGLDKVRNRILDRFRGTVHNIYVYYSFPRESFGAVIFYPLDCDIQRAHNSGLSDQIKDAVFEALEDFGRGRRDEIKVIFEFDSDENIVRNFGGDYTERFR